MIARPHVLDRSNGPLEFDVGATTQPITLSATGASVECFLGSARADFARTVVNDVLQIGTDYDGTTSDIVALVIQKPGGGTESAYGALRFFDYR